jgi:hypothetical protein
MVFGCRHGVDFPNEELGIIIVWWCGGLGVLVDSRGSWITTICCVVYFQPCCWMSNGLSW